MIARPINSKARWVRPVKIRDLLGEAHKPTAIWPPAASAYLVTHREWRDVPDKASRPLYVGISGRMRQRLGDLMADMFGFHDVENNVGKHPGGRLLHKWTKDNRVTAFDLHLAWAENHDCHKCLEAYWHKRLEPELNKVTPSCKDHPRTGR